MKSIKSVERTYDITMINLEKEAHRFLAIQLDFSFHHLLQT